MEIRYYFEIEISFNLYKVYISICVSIIVRNIHFMRFINNLIKNADGLVDYSSIRDKE